MANSYEPDTESDEDCEVYFLKPVNEYNIVDKIKEANKELFGNEDTTSEFNENDKNLELMALSAANRKVSFAANLEEYEPQSGISAQQLDQKLGKESDDLNTESPLQTEGETLKLEVIVEEEPTSGVPEVEKVAEIVTETEVNCVEPQVIETMTSDNDEAIEEICEEILVMDMENDKNESPTHSTQPEPACESPGTLQRRMLKQITFDYDEEQDNKSLTNLLISDNENDDGDDDDDEGNEEEHINNVDDPQDYNCNESLDDTDNEENYAINPHPNTNSTQYYDDDDEDDKLSIIVASYLPDDEFDCDKASLTSDKCTHQSSLRCRTRLPFNKRFSFKRKTKPSNAVANHSHNNVNRRFMPPPEVTDLKLHYKTCCEFKNSQQKLPKYMGYLSEYGLTREQLQEREQKMQQKQRSLLEQTLKKSEDEMRNMHDNERAFTTWLKNKMRFPINKTRNMFDVKRPFGLRRKCTSVGGTATFTQDCENNNMIPNTTRYRSISAKFKKKQQI